MKPALYFACLKHSVIKYPESSLKNNAEYIIQLAGSEGMKAHALAVKVRK